MGLALSNVERTGQRMDNEHDGNWAIADRSSGLTDWVAIRK